MGSLESLIPASGRDLELPELERFVHELARRPELWRQRVRHQRDERFYAQLHRDPHLDVWLICWDAEQETGLHDHDHSSGAVRIVEGNLLEDYFALRNDSIVLETTARTAGSAFSFDATYIHAVRHDGGTPATSIHAYSPALWRMGHYALGPHGLGRTSLTYVEELAAVSTRHRPITKGVAMHVRLLAAVITAALLAVSAATNVEADRGPNASVLQWYDLTTQAVSASGLPEQVSQKRIWAVSWLAAARAAGAHADSRFADAALATALHDTLVALVPATSSADDAQLEASLNAIADSKEKERGISAGHAEAAATLAERAGDGLDTASVNRAWTPPPAAPGVYQLTGGPAVRAGLPDAKPFILASNSQFDPGPPPPLDSSVYLAGLAEVHALGGLTSTQRTPQQTDVARFWAQSSLATYTQILREVLAGDQRPTAAQARIVAAFHVIQIDQQIAIHAAKYRYLFWRPVTSITTGAVDQDATWTPLISTPRHPEYPSGHAGFGGTAEVVLTKLAPSQKRATFTATSSTAGGAARTWTGWRAITDETIDARVWEGVHFRFSDEVGAQLGRDVADYDLENLHTIGL